MSKEIEIKFLVDDLEALRRRLRAAGFREKTRSTHEMNTLYDFDDLRLRNSGQLLRLRLYGEKWTVTHKAKGNQAGRHKSRVETESPVADGKALEQIFRALGLSPTFRYEKFRAEWSDGTGHVVLDQTPIGDVAEIEGPARWIDATARTLNIPRDKYITLNYAAMFFDWKARTGSAAKEMTFRECNRRAPGQLSTTRKSRPERS